MTIANQKLPDGGGGGGGTPGKTPSTPPVNAALVPSSGGLAGLTGLVVVPGLDSNGNMKLLYFDTTTFDTEADCTAQFRIEESDGAQVTIKRVRIKYRNLGSVTAMLTIQGMFTQSADIPIQLGNPAILNGNRRGVKSIADGKIYNAYFDIVFTDESPQVVITRKAGMGPLSIISIAVFGDVHKPQEQ